MYEDNFCEKEPDISLHLCRYGFMPQRTAFWIYWQAVKLMWKGVPFFSPPHKTYRDDLNNKAKNDPLPSGDKFLWREAAEFPFTAG